MSIVNKNEKKAFIAEQNVEQKVSGTQKNPTMNNKQNAPIKGNKKTQSPRKVFPSLTRAARGLNGEAAKIYLELREKMY